MVKECEVDNGLGIVFVKTHSKKFTYAYTCRFAALGGQELILPDIHQSILDDKEIKELFWNIYKECRVSNKCVG